MKVGVITLFPEMFAALNYGVIGRAIERNIVQLTCWQLRDFTHDKHHSVDDRPYGGGPGMVMKTAPLSEAITTVKKALPKAKIVYVSPQGKLFNQAAAMNFSQAEEIVFVAGRYEGIDERLLTTVIDEEWSVGDYVLSGGELAIMTMLDTTIRLLPNVLGDEQSAKLDSFSHGLLEHPHYTRPENFNGLMVPDVLLCGNHAEIARWRLKQSLGKTWQKRPDLLKKIELDATQQQLLAEFIEEELKVKSE